MPVRRAPEAMVPNARRDRNRRSSGRPCHPDRRTRRRTDARVDRWCPNRSRTRAGLAAGATANASAPCFDGRARLGRDPAIVAVARSEIRPSAADRLSALHKQVAAALLGRFGACARLPAARERPRRSDIRLRVDCRFHRRKCRRCRLRYRFRASGTTRHDGEKTTGNERILSVFRPLPMGSEWLRDMPAKR